jgi:hypothetical protein
MSSEKTGVQSGKVKSSFTTIAVIQKISFQPSNYSIQSEKLAVNFEKSASTFATSRQNFQLLAQRISQGASPSDCRQAAGNIVTDAECSRPCRVDWRRTLGVRPRQPACRRRRDFQLNRRGNLRVMGKSTIRAIDDCSWTYRPRSNSASAAEAASLAVEVLLAVDQLL